MRINTNIMSLRAQRALVSATTSVRIALERLSTGRRVNRAGDDAAGLAISENLNAQVRGLRQGVININNAKSVTTVASGALMAQMDFVQRMRELAVQAATGTISESDRDLLNEEFQAIISEIDRVAETTNFGSEVLLNGSFTSRSIQVGINRGESIEFEIEGSRTADIFKAEVATGTFSNSTTFSANLGPRAIVSGNFDDDDRLDIASINSTGYLSIHTQSSSSQFSTTSTLDIGDEDPMSLASGDFNGDGILDLATVSASLINGTPFVGIHLGDGEGNFSTVRTVAVGSQASSLSVGDINEDGDLDIVVGNYGTNSVSVLLGSGNGSFVAGTTVSVGNAPNAKLVDADNDGHLDLVTANALDNTVSVRLGNGNGTFGAEATYDVGTTPVDIALADLNDDDILDIVSANSGDGEISILFGTGSGIFDDSSPTTYAVGSDPRSVVLSDLDGDGDSDVVISDAAAGNLYTFRNNGSGVLTAGVTLSGGSNSAGILAADLNDDGAVDLALAAEGDDLIKAYFNDTEEGVLTPSLHIRTQDAAKDALRTLDNAIQELNVRLAYLGSLERRFESAANATLIGVESLSQARSQIVDADYAEEMASYTRAQILQQATTLVLSKANVSLQVVLNLLKA